MNPSLPVIAFGTNVKEALGAITDPDLTLLGQWEPAQKGDTYKIPSWRPKGSRDTTGAYIPDSARLTATANIKTRKEYAALGSALQTFAEDQLRRTPHMDINEYWTLSTPQTIDAGHTFKKLEEVLTANDPTSRVIKSIAHRFFVSKQKMFVDALKAASVTRMTGSTSTTDTMPTQQQYTVQTAGTLSPKNDFPRIRAILDKANVSDKTVVYGLIHPDDVVKMAVDGWEHIYNNNFVSGENLKAGTIPDIFGIRWIKSVLCPKGSFYCWVPEAMAVVPYSPMESEMSKSAEYCFDIVYYASETRDVKRNDDLGVVHGTITAASDSSSASA